jgi:hypothetical protein
MIAAIARVVVRLDAATENAAAVATAARLAARINAPLLGIFVEDEEFLSLAGLSFAHQVTLGAGVERLTSENAELHLRAAAGRARTQIEAAATRHRVRCTFTVVRGETESGLAEASERDLVVAGGSTRPVAGQFRTECRWWPAAVEAAPGPFLLVQRGGDASGSVVVMPRDRGAVSARLIETAAQIAYATDSLLIVVAAPDAAAAEGFEKWLSDRHAGHAVRLQVEIAPAEPAALQQRIVELNCRLLAIEAGLFEGGGDRLRQFVERFTCDVLLVR